VQTVDGKNVRGPGNREEGEEGENHEDKEEAQYRRSERDGGGQFTWPETNTVDVENMARDAFTRIDDIHNDVVNDGSPMPEDVNMEGPDDGDKVNVENLLRESRERIFDGSGLNRLQCCIVLYSYAPFIRFHTQL